MDFFAGIKGKDFVLVCTDTAAAHSIIRIKHDEQKLVPIDSHRIMATSGEAGDRVNFSEYIVANVKLYALRHGTTLSTKAIANFTRNELATALRRNPYYTNLLVAGYDEGTGPSLYWLDYLATMHKMNAAGTGYGSMFVMSIFDKMWHPELTREEAKEMMLRGIEEIKKRLVTSPPSYQMVYIDSEGVHAPFKV